MAISTKINFTDKAAAFTAAAAYSITQKVIDTWNPFLIRTPRVMVPVQVEALVVRPSAPAQAWADCALKPAPQQTTPVTRYDVLPDPFVELKTPRTAGAYLHWSLPDALTHADASGDTATFPAAPDRWLILRTSPSRRFVGRIGTIGMRSVRGWVLRAGDKDAVAVDLDAFTEGAPSQDAVNNPLTVLGTGDVAWSAYYDNCVNRLAFYDPLSDVAAGPVSYLVCGWYSHPGLDPLGDQSVHSLTDFNTKMKQLGWQLAHGELDESLHFSRKYVVAARGMGLHSNIFTANLAYNDSINANSSAVGYGVSDGPSSMPEFDDNGDALGPYTTDGSWWPNATIMHGSVVAIGWPNVGWPGNEGGLLSGEVGGPPSASAINVAVGNTLTEALAALVARNNKKPEEARILEGFLLGSLSDLEQADGRARLDALLHSTAFGSLDGGFTTETITIPATPDLPPPLPNAVQPGPGVFAGQAAKAANPQNSKFDAGQFKNSTVTLGGHAKARFSESIETIRETTFLTGGLNEVINNVVLHPAPTPIPAHTEVVRRALPRLFYPSEPVFLLEGANRTFKYGADTRHSQDNTLSCRLTGFHTTELSCFMPASLAQTFVGFRPRSTADAVLERSVENGSVPPECEYLLREMILLDPSAAVNLAQAAMTPVAPFRLGIAANNAVAEPAATTGPSAAQINAVARNFIVEQTAWWATRDPRFDHGQLVANSGLAGTLPSPIAVTPPVQPWNPIHLDWQIEYIPSTSGVADWSLGEIDYSTDPKIAPATPDPNATNSDGQHDPQPPGALILSGRAHLTGGAAATAAASLRQALSQAQAAGGAGSLQPNTHPAFHSKYAQIALSAYARMTANINVTIAGLSSSAGGDIPPIDRNALQDILDTLDSMDILAGAADNFTRQLRGGYIPDGKAKPADGSTPVPFVPLRAGFIRVLRLRLVDGYGQFLDLVGSSAATTLDSTKLIESEALDTPTRPELLALPPRFTSPSRLWFRYMAADGSEVEADSATSPVCGFLMPNHLDGDLEFFDASGANLGFVRPDPQAGVIWEDAPGVPSTVGQSPDRAVPNKFAAGIANGLLQWGLADATNTGLKEDALSAMLRIVDSTLWAVDPFSSASDEHLSLLVGHPVVILRARVRLEVQEPIHPEDLITRAVSLRLGAVTHWQDGLLGYFVNDDYTRFYCADRAVAGFARQVGPGQGFLDQASLVDNYYQTFSNDIGDDATEGNSPVNHPYVDDTGLSTIQPNQEVNLTLLVEPHCVVHATAGLLPRKEIGMRREWVAAALAAVSPTFRFGPVLVDPKTIRMPVPNEIHGTWSWDHRADITTWAEDPIVAATQDAHIRPDPVTGTEGWMRMVPPPPPGNSKS